MKDNFNSSLPKDQGSKPIVPKHILMARILASGIEKPSLSTALIIAANAHHGRKNHNNVDYANQYLRIALESNWKSQDDEWRMIAVLSDVVRYSNWDLKDLKDVGFSPRVVKAVSNLTPIEGESYADFVDRCSHCSDSRKVKMRKLDRYKDDGDRPRKQMLRDIVTYRYLYERDEKEISRSYDFKSFVKEFQKRHYDEESFSQPYSLEMDWKEPSVAENTKDKKYPIHTFKKSTPVLNKEELIEYIIASGQKPNMSTALLIAANALHNKKTWNGNDYANHYLYVAFESEWDGADEEIKIIGILHDVIEDSDWTLKDLKRLGFSNRIIRGLDGVTKREDEGYLDLIERSSKNADSRKVKYRDLSHNLDLTRDSGRKPSKKQATLYPLSHAFLEGVRRQKAAAGSSVHEYGLKHCNDLYTSHRKYFESQGGTLPKSEREPKVTTPDTNGSTTINGGHGNDTFHGGLHSDTIIGSAGAQQHTSQTLMSAARPFEPVS